MSGRYIGTTEDRINKWLRMCLQWQFDIRRGIEKKSSHYYKKYHVGKYPKKWFADLATCVVDREYVINKMNLISEDRMKYDLERGVKSNKVVIKQIDIPNYSVTHRTKGVKVNENTILKNVAKSKYDLSEVSTQNLIDELNRRNNGK